MLDETGALHSRLTEIDGVGDARAQEIIDVIEASGVGADVNREAAVDGIQTAWQHVRDRTGEDMKLGFASTELESALVAMGADADLEVE